MPYADVSQYVLASEAIPEIARCYFGGDTSKAESDARIAAREGALPVLLGSLQYIRQDRWHHDYINWSSIYEPLYFPRADLLKIYPDLWRSLQSPDSGTAQSDAAPAEAAPPPTPLGMKPTKVVEERREPRAAVNANASESDSSAGNQKSESANSRRGNPNWIRGPYYEPLRQCLRSQAKILKKNEESLCHWFEGLRRSEFCELVKPALSGIDLPSDRTLYDTGRKIVAEIEKR